MTQTPIYESLRPQQFEDVEGQPHLTGPQGILPKLLKSKSSILLHGPSGCGKTTLARIYAKTLDSSFISISPLSHGIADLKKILETFEKSSLFFSSMRVVFVDEIHRFNKAQQDFFLPFLEKGAFVLVAATTENPACSINPSLLSRIKTFPVYPLNHKALEVILHKLLRKYPEATLSKKAQDALLHSCAGDVRHLINSFETALSLDSTLLEENPETWCIKKHAVCSSAENQYTLISALQKSIRHSKPNAALYYLACLLHTGQDPLYIARRLIRIAAEDIGLADPHALSIANTCWDAFGKLGSPEGDLVLAQCCVYLALSPKSSRLYEAASKSHISATSYAHLPPPQFLTPSHYHPERYNYDATQEEAFFPTHDFTETFYKPKNVGFEIELQKRWEFFKNKCF